VASLFFRSDESGISKENVRISTSAIRDRKRKMVAGLVDLHLDFYKKTGTELVMGSGRFVEIKEPIPEFDVEARYQMLQLSRAKLLDYFFTPKTPSFAALAPEI
jgi:pyruvate/2-oxoglutarate dehydrogenase complex dihydrolipoamide dehydrogenase (E3) component